MTRRLILAIATLLLALTFALPASAADSFTWTITGDELTVIPQPGEGRTLEALSYDVLGHAPQNEWIGTECTFAVFSHNGESVNPANFGVATTYGVDFRLDGVESQPNGSSPEHVFTAVLGSHFGITHHVVPTDGRISTSVYYEVTITCQQGSTTITTSSSTTTSSSVPTSTTAPPTSTSTPPTTTTTAPTSSTTGPAPIPPASTPPSTAIPPVTLTELPFTGPGAEVGLGLAAVALLTLGSGVVIATRERGRHRG